MDVDLISQGRQIVTNAPGNLENQSEKYQNDITVKQQKDDNNSNKIDKGKIQKSVDDLNKLLEKQSTHAEYKVHKYFGDVIIKIVDDRTNKVIKEIPPEKILDMVQKMYEMDGVFVNKKA